MILRTVATILGAILPLAMAGISTASPERLPIATPPPLFVENRGQIAGDARFYVTGSDRTVYFSPSGVTVAILGKEDESPRRWAVKLEFEGADPEAKLRADERQDAVFSFFRGEPETWKTGVPAFRKLVYADLWPGVDLVYSTVQGGLKYEFTVRPGTDPRRIRLVCRGASEVRLAASGALEVTTPVGGFEDGKPFAYQVREGETVQVPVRYEIEGRSLDGDWRYGFELGDHDPEVPLILDPAMLICSGFLGGTGSDYGSDVAVDGEGCVYLTGFTRSSEGNGFPTVSGPDPTFGGGAWDAFVAKVAADGSSLLYCGYLGGSGDDFGDGISVDSEGCAIVYGETSSSEAEGFPVTVGPDLTYNGSGDVFVAKVSPDGASLLYCGYVGGTDAEGGYGDVASDTQGNAYIVGRTYSSAAEGFPVLVGPDLSPGGLDDAFVAKVNADGTALVYCGYIGGSRGDYGNAIDVDADGCAYVTGFTGSSEVEGFPVAVGPDLTFNGATGDYDAFVAKVRADGSGFAYCGYVGGSRKDWGWGIAVGDGGRAYVAGMTFSHEVHGFPVAVGPDTTHNGDTDAFVAKVTFDGTGLAYCGYVGGSDYDRLASIAVGSDGSAHVAGYTESSESEGFPVLVGPDLHYNGGSDDAFVAKVRPGGASLAYCGYLGGGDTDHAAGIARVASGGVAVVGSTGSSSFPVVVGPDLSYNGGNVDAFVTKVYVAIEECQGIDGEQVLTVNGDTGFSHSYRIAVDSAGPLQLAIAKPSGGGNGKFVVHMNAGFPDPGTVEVLPAQLGRFCFPLLLSHGASPVAVWNALGKTDRIGASGYFGEAIPDPARAPTIFLDLPSGDAVHLPAGSQWTLQGLILNPAASSPKGGSVTNAIEIEFL